MATLIPSYSTCVNRMTGGERRFAQRLEAKLEDDYLCWYEVAVGPTHSHPDFVILHPRRGLLVLEVKDWKPETIQAITKQDATLLTERGIVHVINPLEQARQYVHAITNTLQKDPQLVFASGSHQGQLTFPWAYGVVLANISRKVFDESGMGDVLPAGRVICQDEMTESVDAEAFQERLWQMFQIQFRGSLSLPQLDRIRWHMFPEIRLPVPQEDLFAAQAQTAQVDVPDLMRVMDLQQEQLARSLGEGHRVIHGVAGSGKTLILGYRAEQLAKGCEKPILVLCYNRKLADKLKVWMTEKNIADKVHVRTFHAWCSSQLRAFNVNFKYEGEDDFNQEMAAMVEAVIRATDRGAIPGAQYDAVMIDEGHDFRPEWLKLVVQMVDPRTNSLLVLYDDAQSIYDTGGKKNFSFKSVGIQAQGRTTVLKINYRNTREILDFATRFAGDLLLGSEAEEDGVPRLAPISAGRSGKEPLVINLPTLQEESAWIATKLKEEHANGRAWRDMAVLFRHYEPTCKTVMSHLQKAGVPCTYQKQVSFDKGQDTVKFITFHSSKGLEFPLVLIPGADLLQSPDKTTEEEARLLYVAMTRATQQLIVTGVA
ncbi:MAG: NERD domain-containing protein [Rhodocyclaceae bacterium]|nr:NERD domain-containing protein [Rhodocyclaceae bacterium]